MVSKSKQLSDRIIKRCIRWAKEHIKHVIDRNSASVLAVLVLWRSSIRYKELEEISGVRGGALENILRRLEKDGIVKRVKINKSTFIELTEKGEIEAKGLLSLIRYVVRYRLDSSNIYNEEEKELLRSIDRLIEDKIDRLIEKGRLARSAKSKAMSPAEVDSRVSITIGRC